MAQRVHIVLEDDIDGSEATETVSFGLDGTNYEMDLNAEHAAELREALAPYIGQARKASARRGRPRGRSSAASARKHAPREVRDWARAHGYEVTDRGRIPAEIQEAFDAAH